MKKNLLLFICAFVAQLAFAQAQAVKGTVLDSSGEPVIGATVKVLGTKQATVTDIDGNFTIQEVNPNASINISYVGMQPVTLKASGNLNVTLKDDFQNLNDVVVIGYGSAKAKDLTSPITVVKAADIQSTPSSSPMTALQGKVAGVNVVSSGTPGAGPTVRIRGTGSFANSSPLYVVDGTAYNGYINAINPNDIESMTVLKDASATALYGSRAANGVVMITTKKGASEKGQINFRSTWGFSSLAVDLPRALTPQEFTELAWTGIMNGYMDSGISASDAAKMATDNLANELKINPWNMDKPVGLDGKLDPNAKLKFSGDWRDALLKSRLRQEYTIDFSGKSQKADYFISAGYLNDKGVFSTQEYERFSVRGSMNYDVKKWMKVGLNNPIF